jgi:hypothetical protein
VRSCFISVTTESKLKFSGAATLTFGFEVLAFGAPSAVFVLETGFDAPGPLALSLSFLLCVEAEVDVDVEEDEGDADVVVEGVDVDVDDFPLVEAPAAAASVPLPLPFTFPSDFFPLDLNELDEPDEPDEPDVSFEPALLDVFSSVDAVPVVVVSEAALSVLGFFQNGPARQTEFCAIRHAQAKTKAV